jgi:hypothetical protein
LKKTIIQNNEKQSGTAVVLFAMFCSSLATDQGILSGFQYAIKALQKISDRTDFFSQ